MNNPNFTKKQLVFIVEFAIVSVIDRMQGFLPQTPTTSDWHDYLTRKPEQDYYFHGLQATLDAFLPILYAQTTNDGMGNGDHVIYESLEKLFKKFEQKWLEIYELPQKENFIELEQKLIAKTKKRIHKLAKKFVKEHFHEYFVRQEVVQAMRLP